MSVAMFFLFTTQLMLALGPIPADPNDNDATDDTDIDIEAGSFVNGNDVKAGCSLVRCGRAAGGVGGPVVGEALTKPLLAADGGPAASGSSLVFEV